MFLYITLNSCIGIEIQIVGAKHAYKLFGVIPLLRENLEFPPLSICHLFNFRVFTLSHNGTKNPIQEKVSDQNFK